MTRGTRWRSCSSSLRLACSRSDWWTKYHSNVSLLWRMHAPGKEFRNTPSTLRNLELPKPRRLDFLRRRKSVWNFGLQNSLAGEIQSVHQEMWACPMLIVEVPHSYLSMLEKLMLSLADRNLSLPSSEMTHTSFRSEPKTRMLYARKPVKLPNRH